MKAGGLLQGMYYPYADLRPSQALLEACLYLDRVYILEPNFFHPPEGAHTADRVPSVPSMQPLLAAGLIEPIGPALLGMADSPSSQPVLDEDNLALLRSSISQDLADTELTRMTAEAGFVSWAIPTGQQLFWNGLGLLLERQDGKTRIHTDRPDYYRGLLNKLGYGHHPVVQRDRGGHPDLQVEVPFLEAESLMLTVALLASSELGLHPITDNEFHEAFLRRKLNRMLAQPELRDALRPIVPATREAELGLHTIRLNIPRLAELDAERVVKLRERCHDSLDEFRVHLRALSYKIQSEPWSAEFEQDCQRVVATEIQPALRKLRGDLGDKARSLGVRIAAATAKTAPLPLLATLATGLPPEVLLAAGAGVTALHELVTYLVERRSIQRNGLYFLLDAKI